MNHSPNQVHNPLEGERPELTIKLHEGVDDKVSIIIVHRDRPEYLCICLQSIVVNSTSNDYEVIVVDNASTGQDAKDYLDSLEGEVKIVRNQENLYWSEAANLGVAAASKLSRYYIFLHCDVVVLNPAWIDLLSTVAQAQGAGIVGTSIQSYYFGERKMEFIEEWCMLVTRECWEDVGPWPAELKLVGAAFLMNLRAIRKGHKPQAIKNNVAHHYHIFSLNVSEYERFCEQAMTCIPSLANEIRAI